MTETRTSLRNLKHLAQLRLLVGYLGERNQKRWWDTAFLDQTGQGYLRTVFPRTPWAAGVRATGEAARNLHDERIGKVGTYHLFRLPVALEDRLERVLNDEELAAWSADLKDAPAALAALDRLGQDRLEAPEGPVQVGTTRHILRKDSIAELARHYRSAMDKGRMCFPYFAG